MDARFLRNKTSCGTTRDYDSTDIADRNCPSSPDSVNAPGLRLPHSPFLIGPWLAPPPHPRMDLKVSISGVKPKKGFETENSYIYIIIV